MKCRSLSNGVSSPDVRICSSSSLPRLSSTLTSSDVWMVGGPLAKNPAHNQAPARIRRNSVTIRAERDKRFIENDEPLPGLGSLPRQAVGEEQATSLFPVSLKSPRPTAPGSAGPGGNRLDCPRRWSSQAEKQRERNGLPRPGVGVPRGTLVLAGKPSDM
uniref:Uncharacterized protein n=1 Tax=Myotis myotis TaxID=51298 RepID=A0A7J7RL41_MYOMY|nr:hypothetical protein mMyoMyo1_010302 [Myotis myotis]